jgi:nucleoside-diphosphate-sugar epimerase
MFLNQYPRSPRGWCRVAAVMSRPTDADWVVVGSGFGGSVAALRLAEKGYSVRVLESGSRFRDEDFARTTWDARRYFFAPRLGLRGIMRTTLFPDVLIVSGAGVGGGSLGYANTVQMLLQAAQSAPRYQNGRIGTISLSPKQS